MRVSVEDFHKAYDQTVAVRGISFKLTEGQIMGLIGPNGAGKTTTLRALAGIIPASRGRLAVAGFDIERDALEAKRRLAYIPDDPQLFQDLTVWQHLSFAASAYQVEEADGKIDRLVRDFQLEKKLQSPVSDLSRGMKQKLAVCAAYLHDPVAIFFDEPLTGLDPHGIRAEGFDLQASRIRGGDDHQFASVGDGRGHLLARLDPQRRGATVLGPDRRGSAPIRG